MAIKRNKRFHAEVATSALSDIMFFLLLFFLIISTLANPNVIKVPLPKSNSNETTNKQHVTLTVTVDKKYYINVGSYKEEITKAQIRARLVAETKKLKDETVVIRIPGESQVQELVDLLDIAIDVNLKIIINTDPH
jgi:biopolymer transport protein ExbD